MRNIWQPYDSCIPIDEKYVTTIIQLYLKSKKLICWNRNCGLPKPWSDQSTRWTACRYQGIVSFPQHVIFVIIIFCIFIVIVIIIIVIVICDHHHRYAYLRNHHHCYHHHHSYCRRLERNLIEEINIIVICDHHHHHTRLRNHQYHHQSHCSAGDLSETSLRKSLHLLSEVHPA